MQYEYTLQDIIDKYKFFGATDEEIIKLYFQKNHIEEQAVKLLVDFSEDRIKLLNSKYDFMKEEVEYCTSILDNDIPDQDKKDLFYLAKKFIFYKDLTEEELNKCKDIFTRNKISTCPIGFLTYLNKHIELSKPYSNIGYEDMLNTIIKYRED